MRTSIILSILLLTACEKVGGSSGVWNQMKGDWAEVKLPKDCVVSQIAAESNTGVVVLCRDGRVFH